MRSLRRTFAVFAAALVFGPGTALAIGHGTPDGSPPAEEAVCDDLIGAGYGLCVAFCEANDCDQFPTKKGNKKACEALRTNYARITGELAFPCEVVPDPGDS